MAEPHVQLILERNEVPRSLQRALNRLKARVSIRSMDKAAAGGVSNSADVCVVLTGNDQSPGTLDRILHQADERDCPMMVLTPEGVTTPREPGIDAHQTQSTNAPATTAELAGRILALCEIRRPKR